MERLIFLLVLASSIALAVPSIGSVTGSLTHGQNMTITGSDFGPKEPALPLMWDDCEGRAAGNPPSSLANDFSRVGYSDWQPTAVRDGDVIPDTHTISYQNVGYAPTGHAGIMLSPVESPHGRSSMYLQGGHFFNDSFCGGDYSGDEPVYDPIYWNCSGVQFDGGNNGGRDISATVYSAENSSRWFVSFYYRLNPDWPTGNSQGFCDDPDYRCMNHKFAVYQKSHQAYGAGDNAYVYQNFVNGLSPATNESYLKVTTSLRDTTCGNPDGNCYTAAFEPCCNVYDRFGDGGARNPKHAWVKVNHALVSDDIMPMRNIYFDNQLVWECDDCDDWFQINRGGGMNIGSYSIGGYYEYAKDPAGTSGAPWNIQHSSAHRFFDDIYIDNTLSRVVLADSQTYADAGTVEPQVPLEWGSDSVEISVNLGALDTSQPVYMFVFDENNSMNPEGYVISPEQFHAADTDQDGTIENPEIRGYVDLWFRGEVSLSGLLSGIEAWKAS